MSSSSSCISSSAELQSSPMLSEPSAGGVLSSQVEPEAVGMPDDPRYYIILIPRFGVHEVMGFDNAKAMIKELTGWLEKKHQQLYDGEVLLFQGRVIEYSDPIMNFRLNIPGKGELTVSGGSKEKYTQFTPKEFE